MPETMYLSIDEVIALHNRGMERMGAPHTPLLFPDKLESALNRPRQLAFYDPNADLIAQAIVLAIGISQAQAFCDGNKRTAFAVADTFLVRNGVDFTGDRITFACWMISAAGNISNDDLDLVAETLGLDEAADLDAMGRAAVVERFETWLRANVSLHRPEDLMRKNGWPK